MKRRFAQQAAKDVGLTKEATADFQMYVADWRAQYLQEHDGREPTRKEMQDAVAEALLYGDEKGGGWFSPNRYKFQAERKGEPFTPFAPEEQKYRPSSDLGAPTTTAPAPPARGRSLDIPADERAQIIEALKATGKPVSEDAIKDRYARMLSRRGG